MPQDNGTIVVTEPAEGSPPPPAGEAGNGFIAGVEQPAISGRQSTFTDQQPPAQQQGRTFAEEDIQRARSEERDKLMRRREQDSDKLTKMEQQLGELQAARDAEEAQRVEAERARVAAEEAAAREKMTTKEYVDTLNAEWQQKFAANEADRQRAEALLEKERQFHALEQYKTQRLSDPEVINNLIPHLQQYIGGSTTEEIDESIARALATSQGIVGEVQAAQQAQRQAAPGVSPYAPTGGPIDPGTQSRNLSNDDIANMSMADWARYRGQILPQANPHR